MNAYGNKTAEINAHMENILSDIDTLKMLVKDNNPHDVIIRTIERLQRECKRLDNAIER